MIGRLAALNEEHQQSPWLDNLRRGWLTGGELNQWVERGIRGLTSNPSIFQKAIDSSDDYDEQFGDLVRSGDSVDSAYWQLVTSDISGALSALGPVHDFIERYRRIRLGRSGSCSGSRHPTRPCAPHVELHEIHRAAEPDGEDSRHCRRTACDQADDRPRATAST